ncbi:MAG TPA: hypothetical protein VI818_08910, partial [Candidatus Thermoplasmatota archaeon]|nr:hypothetical protein [Candidatus Thermoplasmatota archaeon]
MGNWLLASLAALILAGAGCVAPTATQLAQTPKGPPPEVLPDIEASGPFEVARVEYDFGPVPLIFQDSRGAPYPSRLQGSLHFPTTGQAPFPLVVFMHGRHSTCSYAGTEFLGPAVCPDTPATKNVRSFAGYDYISQPLASHGYVIVSIDTNSINDLDLSMGDQGAVGRAQLISRTLDEFAKLNKSAGPAPIQGRLVGKIDFGRIGLMGHSRGGEGVTRFISWNEQRTDGPRYPLLGVFALAPTDFARWKVANVTHAALLPYCDGDVFNLHGAWMYDDARYLAESRPSPKIQILAMGSNHNNYNTIWTGDDGGGFRSDAHCGPSNPSSTKAGGRLAPDDQRRHGRVYMEAFFRHYVGGERGWNGLFTGRQAPPPAACPEGLYPCEDVVHVSYHAPAPDRLTLED